MKAKAATTILVILIAVCSMGAVQVKRFIGTLRTSEGERLAEREGRMVLVRSRANKEELKGRITGIRDRGSIYSDGYSYAFDAQDLRGLPFNQSLVGQTVEFTPERIPFNDQRRGMAGVSFARNIHKVTNEWRISAPHLQTVDGKFLAIEQGEAGVQILLTSEKGDSARWVIEVTGSSSPRQAEKEQKGMLEGWKRQTFRLRVFDGRYEGWYLSAAKPAEQQVKSAADHQTVRELQVVEDPKQALSLEYIDTYYEVIHK